MLNAPLFLAIPSPDLVINLFASASQVLGLVAVGASGLVMRDRRGRRKNAPGGGGSSGSRATLVLGILWLATGASFLLYHLRVEDAQTARLRQALVRPSQEAGQAVGDDSLKTLGFSAQKEHPAGLSTEDLAASIEAGEEVHLIDVREPEEAELGGIPGSLALPYPDLLAGLHDDVLVEDSILLCYSGNRSSELVEALSARVPSLRFVVGGFEKWLTEDRPLANVDSGRGRDLRALAPFPGDEVLLDTESVEDLVEGGDVLFVDVRYPEDFNIGHLPGAVNVPLRKLTREEGQRQLAALPEGRIIVPCYDKRSSFYASILGLRTSRMGRTFLGRYTLPEEYVGKKSERAHLQAWRQAQAGLTPYGWLVDRLGAGLKAVCSWLGLGWGIIVGAFLARLLTLPLSWKGSRDHWVELTQKASWKKLGSRFAADPVRKQRAVSRARSQAGLTPMWNLAGSLSQLVLFLALLTSVGHVSSELAEASGSFLWVPRLDHPDPLGIFPIVSGLLAGALVFQGRKASARVWAGAFAAAALLTGLAWTLQAAQGAYLVVSLGWVLGQGRAAQRVVMGRKSNPTARILNLDRCAGRIEVGRKAERLGVLTSEGFPVPSGFAVTTFGLAAMADPTTRAAVSRQIQRAFRKLGADKVAVRSSGLAEDGENCSFAGIFDTLLKVKSEDLLESIDKVAASLDSTLAKANGSEGEGGAVLVQAMVPADHAGVMFTEHPQEAGSAMVEWTSGLGEELVGGQVTPDVASFGRITGKAHDEGNLEAMVFDPLLEMGRRIEDHFGTPQDVEWALAGGKFWILQARDVTVRAGSDGSGEQLFERERQRLLAAAQGCEAGEDLFVQDGLAELAPEPTPFSARLLADMWGPGGTVDLACRSLGVRFQPEEDGPDRIQYGFGRLWNHLAVQHGQDQGLSPMAGFRLSRSVDGLAVEVEELAKRAQAIRPLDEALDLTALSGKRLVELYEERLEHFLEEAYVTAERVNVAAQWFLEGAQTRLLKAGLEPGAHLAPQPTPMSRALGALPAIARGESPLTEFTAPMAHRAEHDFELSEPRYGEEPAKVKVLVDRVRAGAAAEAAHEAALVDGAPTEKAEVPTLKGVTAATVERAVRLQALKEEAKHYALVDLAVVRRIVLELGHRAGLDEDEVWLLEPSDIAQLLRQEDNRVILPVELRVKVAEATRLREHLEGLELPVRLTPSDVESVGREGLILEFSAEASTVLRGTRVAGSGAAVGQVRVCSSPDDLADFVPGEILVTRFTDPSWSMVFSTAAGLVTEVGGWLSHAAILAREKGLAAVVGVPGATARLKTGQWVRLGTDGRVEPISAVEALEGEDSPSQSRMAAGG